jgi:hypothetical protein
VAGVAAATATTFFILEALDGRGHAAEPAPAGAYVVPVITDSWVGLGAGREF